MRKHRLFEPPQPLFQPMLCPRCGTPLALVGSGPAALLEPYTTTISSAARTLSARLARYQSGATIPAYLLVRAADRSVAYVALVWPEYQAARLSVEDFAAVRPALQALHRCLRLARLY